LALLVLLLHGRLQAAPVILNQGSTSVQLDGQAQFWVEPGRARKVEQVEAEAASLPWAVRQPGQQHAIDQKTLWIRFDAVITGRDRWYLTVGSSGIDRVQMFYRDENGRWIAQEAGDSRPVSQWPVPGRAPTFELSPVSGQIVTYWLRIEHDRVDFAASLDLYNQAQLLAVREREQFLLGAYFGLAALLSVVALANAVGWRDRNFAAYALYMGTFALGQAAYIGVGAQHLWDRWLEWNALSTFLLPALGAAAALWFVQVVTEPARFSRRLNQAVWALIIGLVVAALLDVWLPTRTILLARLVLSTAAIVMVAVLIGLVWRKGDDAGIRLIALGFVPVLVMALFPIARGMNLVPNSIFTRYGLAMGSALEMPILFYALSLRAHRRREGQLRASALPRTDALTGLADRRSLLQRMEASLARARSQKHGCALLVIKLANYDTIATDYGRDMLDRALVVTGSLLRRCASDIDLAARVGEREFALLLEGPTTPDAATARAQQLVAGGLRQAQALPNEMTLRLQIVVAMLPDQQGDAAASLQWALAALSSVRADSRKQIRALNF
jgi:diguanylate cyclase (GGDEF)-like protein